MMDGLDVIKWEVSEMSSNLSDRQESLVKEQTLLEKYMIFGVIISPFSTFIAIYNSDGTIPTVMGIVSAIAFIILFRKEISPVIFSIIYMLLIVSRLILLLIIIAASALILPILFRDIWNAPIGVPLALLLIICVASFVWYAINSTLSSDKTIISNEFSIRIGIFNEPTTKWDVIKRGILVIVNIGVFSMNVCVVVTLLHFALGINFLEFLQNFNGSSLLSPIGVLRGNTALVFLTLILTFSRVCFSLIHFLVQLLIFIQKYNVNPA